MVNFAFPNSYPLSGVVWNLGGYAVRNDKPIEMSNDFNDDSRRAPRGGRQINFDDDDFAGDAPATQRRRPSRPVDDYAPGDERDYGRRDRDWADDLATRADGRISADYDDYHRGNPAATRQRRQRSERQESSRRRIEERPYSDDEYYSSPSDPQDMERPASFVRRHPVLMNFIYAITAAAVLLWVLMWFLDFWTFHGQERVVPDVKGQTYASAAGNVDLSGLRAVITDSVFDSYSRPGTVVEQVPVAGAKIKKGGTVYLTIVAFTPKLVTVPEFYNVSVRQARSMFAGLGISDIREVPVVSEYEGLVLGAKFNGVALQPGARIPVSAVVTLEVGSGYSLDEEIGAAVDTVAIDTAIDELSIE